MSETDQRRREIEERLKRQKEEEFRALTERHRRRLQTLDLIETLEERDARGEPPQPIPQPEPLVDKRMASKIWRDNTWDIERQLPMYEKLCHSYPYILGKVCAYKDYYMPGVVDTNMFYVSNDRRLAYERFHFDRIHWYLYIDRVLYVPAVKEERRTYFLENLQECGHHLFVNLERELVYVYYQSKVKTVGQEIRINSVIPYCRFGKTCYGMLMVLSERPQGVRNWWLYANEEDNKSGFFEMFQPSISLETRLERFNLSDDSVRVTAILLHSDAKLLMRDFSSEYQLWCNTLFQGGSLIMFDRPLVIYIEDELKYVTLQQLVDCSAIESTIVSLPHTLLMLQQMRSQTHSSVWCANVDIMGSHEEKRVVLRMADRNTISSMWYWSSDWKSGLSYVQWYQNTRDWSRKFEYETQQFSRPFDDLAQSRIEPTKLWTKINPKNWVFN